MSFHITLPSSSSKLYFANNSASDFTTKLPQTLFFEPNKWEFGISEVIFPRNLYNIRKNMNEVIIYRVTKKRPERAWIPKRLFHLPSGFYKDTSQIIDYI